MLASRKGFTLIELLIVVVIIGILAAIAIPKFNSAREKAYFSAMMSDLKNLATQQEVYYAHHYRYADDENPALGFVSSDGVWVTTIEASQMGWSAYATHEALGSTLGCAIYLGKATAPTTHGAPTQAGTVACQMTP